MKMAGSCSQPEPVVWVKEGASLPFINKTPPTPEEGWKPHKSRHLDTKVLKTIKEVVQAGLDDGQWRRVDEDEVSPFVVRMFLVVKVRPDGTIKYRPILDFRPLNKCLKVPRIRERSHSPT